MAEVVSARDAYLAARRMVEQRRLELGLAISQARKAGKQQEEIASMLGLTREQVRRYQREYERKALTLADS
jgi:predicted transcriptional regulator